MNDQIQLKIISLPHREDRRNECLSELAKISILGTGNMFFQAKYIENLGALGCSLSHAMALSEFLFNSNKPFALILEDDFEIQDGTDFVEKIDSAIASASYWNVFLLGHNIAVPIENTNIGGVLRVINAQTTPGYLVGRLYASRLIESHFRSAEMLRQYKDLPLPNREYAKSVFCCDILWKNLQVEDKYWGAFPPLIKQRKSFSDIEKTVVDYGV